jgi:Fur family ferric uptake transcriptional regulator
MKCVQHNQESRSLLKQGRLKSTPARLRLLDILKHAQKPLSVNELFAQLKGSKIDKVTLYRNVESLAQLGICRQIRLKDRQAYFELVEKQHHHHLVCAQCGKITDIANCGLGLIDKKLLKKLGFASVEEHSLEFFGICANCALHNG